MDPLQDTWSLEFHTGIPVYRQIMNHVQAAVATGKLAAGDALPSIRALHEKLQVNPNTVAKAYRELQQLGLIASEHGSGCFVAPDATRRSPALPAAERKQRARELCQRFLAEAHRCGLSIDDLLQQLQRQHPT